ncbi:MAG: CysS/YqeB C-terminal domain-containing protein [Pseudonocardia sp.]
MTTRPGRLVIMGSGETAPTMVEVHRATLRAAGEGPALLLDTPYGFQENADDITEKAIAYFGRNVGREVAALRWRERLDGAELDRALAAVRGARWVFAGPGSPTYALRVWAGAGFDDAAATVVAGGGTVTFASAAALTLGTSTVPVYEIYKSGADPSWAAGTNLLERLTGLRAAVIPHYDNAEGGTHSTRFCYLGERRLRLLECALPEGAHVIGVDEHTALVLDLADGTASVLGNGTVTVRFDGTSRTLPTGTSVPITDLASRESGSSTARVGVSASASRGFQQPESRRSAAVAASLRDAADRARTAFDAALAVRDADAAAGAVLDLEQAIADWTADTLQSDDADHARRTLRGMVLELARAARDGLADPAERVAPLVEALLNERAAARAARDFARADELRDRLAAAGVEVRDSPAGAQWSLTAS